MCRPVFNLGFAFVLLLLCVGTGHAQTLSNCRPTPPLSAHAKPGVGGLSLSHNGKTLVVAAGDGKIRFINVATGRVQRILSGHTNAIYKAIFNPDEKLLASSSRDRTARIWEVASGRELRQLGGFRCSVKAVAFSPRYDILAASGNDGMIKVWSVETGAELKSLVHLNSSDIDMAAHSLAFSQYGKHLYAGNGDGTISEWDVAAGKESRILKAHNSGIMSLVFSPDYRLLASISDSVLKLWDTYNWREVQSLPMTRMAGLGQHSGAIAFSHNGKLVAASDMGLNVKQNAYVYIQALVWDVKTGERLFTLEGHKFDIDALLFTSDDRYLLTGSADTTIKFWDMKTGRLTQTLTMPKPTE